MKKFLSVLLALAMIFSLTVTVSADETKGEMDGYVVVLHTNDVHGAISGYAKVAALKKAYEAEGANVLLWTPATSARAIPRSAFLRVKRLLN